MWNRDDDEYDREEHYRAEMREMRDQWNQAMKFCRDCRHCEAHHYGLESDFTLARCRAGPVYINPVSGASTHWYCSVMRQSNDPDKCGGEGRLFEPIVKEAAA